MPKLKWVQPELQMQGLQMVLFQVISQLLSLKLMHLPLTELFSFNSWFPHSPTMYRLIDTGHSLSLPLSLSPWPACTEETLPTAYFLPSPLQGCWGQGCKLVPVFSCGFQSCPWDGAHEAATSGYHWGWGEAFWRKQFFVGGRGLGRKKSNWRLWKRTAF